MCGIAGFCDFNKKVNKNILKKMTDVLHHRGPDDSGYSFYQNEFANIGLGHKRLSILDLSSHGHQPMQYKDLEIVYNGEVYNFLEIKKELEQFGYSFDSDSDTEVILKAYHKWGIKAVDKFNGMFSIVIYDNKAQKIICIRDRAGVKPFYYYWGNQNFMFASELKSFYKNDSFDKKIDLSSIELYLQYSYIPQPNTIFQNTYKLKSGFYLELDLKSQSINDYKYWDISDLYQKDEVNISYADAKSILKEHFIRSIDYRLKADVEVGVFLSGGYDSSLVASIAQQNLNKKVKTFTIGFNESKFNEACYAKEIAKVIGSEHHELYATVDDFNDVIQDLPFFYDEPFGDSSAIPTTLVSKLASEHVKVSLSADGGDELFCGYSRYQDSLKNYNTIKKIPPFFRKVISNTSQKFNLSECKFFEKIYNFETKYNKLASLGKINNVTDMYSVSMTYFTQYEIKALLLDKSKSNTNTFFNEYINMSSDLKTIMSIDFKTYLVDEIMTKVDRASMSKSLESREPLLDYKLIDFVSKLPDSYKYNDGITKYILKDIVHDYIPKNMMDRPKMGFVAPLPLWLKDKLYYLIEENLNKDAIESSGVFDFDTVQSMVTKYLSGKTEITQKIWFIIMFQMWYKKWM